MDLRKLEIFVAVARQLSFSQAANQLHMAQPAVSIAVRKLEQELELPLFDRSGRRPTLTAEGRDLLGRAAAILQQVGELRQSLSDHQQLLQGELAIACPSMLATYYLPELLADFLREHPGLRASITQAGTARVEQMLLDDDSELGVITDGGSADTSRLELVHLIDEQIVLCMPATHPWAGRSEIGVEELQGSPMVVYASGYFVRNKLDQLCADAGVSPDFRMQTNFLPLLIRMVREGLGTTVGLTIMAAEEAGLVGVPLAADSGISMALAKRRGRIISRANQAFLDWAAFKL